MCVFTITGRRPRVHSSKVATNLAKDNSTKYENLRRHAHDTRTPKLYTVSTETHIDQRDGGNAHNSWRGRGVRLAHSRVSGRAHDGRRAMLQVNSCTEPRTQANTTNISSA